MWYTTNMKRYLLFCFYNYYPAGGWEDFVGSFDTVAKAKKARDYRDGEYYHIVDSTTGKIVFEN